MERFVTSFEEIGREEGLVEGREEGLAKGIVEGRTDERRALVLRQLTRKVGPLAPELQARIAALDPEALLTLSEALLDFTSMADLTAWLTEQVSLL